MTYWYWDRPGIENRKLHSMELGKTKKSVRSVVCRVIGRFKMSSNLNLCTNAHDIHASNVLQRRTENSIFQIDAWTCIASVRTHICTAEWKWKGGVAHGNRSRFAHSDISFDGWTAVSFVFGGIENTLTCRDSSVELVQVSKYSTQDVMALHLQAVCRIGQDPFVCWNPKCSHCNFSLF